MIGKYYSLDECFEQDSIYDKLDELSNESKIEYEIIEDEVIKIKDLSLSLKEKKELLKFFEENDVIEYNDFDDDEDDEDDDEDFEDEDDYDDDYF